MKIQKEEIENSRVRLNIEIEEVVVDKALDRAYRKVVKDVRLPGFRKGKVPRKILEARFGDEVLHQDALEIIIPDVLKTAYDEHEIEPIDQPDLKTYHLKAGEKGQLEIEVEVKPEVDLGPYTGLGVKKDEIEIKEEDIDKVIQSLRDQQATLVATDRTVVQKDDYVIIDFEGFINGETIEGGKGEDYTLGIGNNNFLPEFDERLTGAEVGKEVEFAVNFPEDYHSKDLAGKEAQFKVKVKELKVKELPEVNDEFAQSVGEYEDLKALKEDIKKSIETRRNEEVQIKFENEVLDKVAENTSVEIPDKLVEQRLDTLFHETSMDLQDRGMKLEQYLEATGSSVEQWRKDRRKNAKRQVRNRLILEAVAAKEGCEVTQEEIDKEIEYIVKGTEHNPEKFKGEMAEKGYLGVLEVDLKRQKALDFLLEKNKLEE